MHKYVYLFTEGNGSMRELLGGKGANLAEMTNIGLPVPQGFTISTEACTQYYEDGRKINDDIQAEIMEYVKKLENITGKKFVTASNKFHALTSKDELVFAHGAIKALASDMMKIANDVRWLASGPSDGLGEFF